jgi:hypothetical protein
MDSFCNIFKGQGVTVSLNTATVCRYSVTSVSTDSPFDWLVLSRMSGFRKWCLADLVTTLIAQPGLDQALGSRAIIGEASTGKNYRQARRQVTTGDSYRQTG